MEEIASKYAADGLKVVKISLEPGRNAKKVKPLYSEMEVRELPTFILFKASSKWKMRRNWSFWMVFG